MKQKRLSLAVKSKYASVYNAFITECEKIGWVWVEQFNSKSRVNIYICAENDQFGSIYLSNEFSWAMGKELFSFSTTNEERIDLDTDFELALSMARTIYDKIAKAYTMELTDNYKAIIDDDMIIVGCQRISFQKFDELKELVNQYKRDKK